MKRKSSEGFKGSRSHAPPANHDDEEDVELEAEIQAVKMMKTEAASKASGGAKELKPTTYNRDGLTHCLKSLPSYSLDFKELMSISDFETPVPNEHDDLEREVSTTRIVYIYRHLTYCKHYLDFIL